MKKRYLTFLSTTSALASIARFDLARAMRMQLYTMEWSTLLRLSSVTVGKHTDNSTATAATFARSSLLHVSACVERFTPMYRQMSNLAFSLWKDSQRLTLANIR